MKIGVLGTGMVGDAIASKLVELGHEVMMGSRTPDNEKAAAWVKKAGDNASQGTFAAASAHGEIVFNCTKGMVALDALRAAGADNLKGKVLIDTSNPLDFSQGMPPRLSVCNDDSLGEAIQREFPDTRVVKTLNTMNCHIMVDAKRVPGEHTVFVSGNDAGAKEKVTGILRDWFGWRQVIDLGDISTARGTEGFLMLWIRMFGALGTPDFNIGIIHVAK